MRSVPRTVAAQLDKASHLCGRSGVEFVHSHSSTSPIGVVTALLRAMIAIIPNLLVRSTNSWTVHG